MTVSNVPAVNLLNTFPYKQIVHDSAQRTFSSPLSTFNHSREGSEASSIAGKQPLACRKPYYHQYRRSRISGMTCAASQSPASLGESHKEVMQFSEVCSIAESRGMHVNLKTFGPLYTIVCKDGGANGTLLATTNGFVIPALNLMHCDTMRVFTSRLAEGDRDRIRGGSFFGLSLLIAAAVMSHGYACGCIKAEMLAINDDDHQHRRLVKYYKRLGFHPILEVGNNGISDIPHLLVWGGAGTRMNCIPEQFLTRWARTLRRTAT